MPAFVMGGMALASGIFGAFGAASQADAQAKQAEINQRNENFRNRWQVDIQNRNQLRQFQSALEQNIQLEREATRERALAELYLDKTFENSKSTLSKQTAKATSSFVSTMEGRNIGMRSGTARALMRQNMEALSANMLALKTNYLNSYRDIERKQQARLAQRADTMYPSMVTFIPNNAAILNSSSSALTTGLIQAGIGGASAGYGAYLQYGAGGVGGLFGGGGGSGTDASLSASALASRQAMRGFD